MKCTTDAFLFPNKTVLCVFITLYSKFVTYIVHIYN